jgi:transposase
MARCLGSDAKKKSLIASEHERPDVKAQREVWLDRLADACSGDYSRVLFLDETGALTNYVRTHGRSPRHERCRSHAPAGHWKVMTAVAAVRLEGLVAPMTIDCAMDGDVFEAYARQVLLPVLREGDVVVMDNLSSHKKSAIATLIATAGAEVMYLPPYSPDFNPIEMIWSKVKRLLRTIAARSIETLHHAFGEAFAQVTTSDIAGCFQHCGYATGKGAPL